MYLPEKKLQVVDLSEEQIISAYKNNSNIAVHVERWNPKKNRLEIRVGEYTGTISLYQTTIYLTEDLDDLKSKCMRLVGKKVSCKILKFNLAQKKLILSRAKSMEEAREYFEKNPYIQNAYIKKLIDRTAFIELGYGVMGKLKLHNYTNCAFKTIRDTGLREGDKIPVKIIGGISEKNHVFKLSYKEIYYKSDIDMISNCFVEGDIIECTIGEELCNGTGSFVDFLPNVCGIVDTIRYDYLVDDTGKKCADHAIPPLETGRKAKIMIKSIDKDQKKKFRFRGRFLKYCD